MKQLAAQIHAFLDQWIVIGQRRHRECRAHGEFERRELLWHEQRRGLRRRGGFGDRFKHIWRDAESARQILFQGQGQRITIPGVGCDTIFGKRDILHAINHRRDIEDHWNDRFIAQIERELERDFSPEWITR